MIKTCAICGEPLKRGAKKYCTIACRGEGTRRKTLASRPPCEKCGEPVKQPGYRFCSQLCAGKARQERHPCAQCGKPTHLQKEFCQRECYVAAGRSKWITLTCDRCGVAFQRYPSQRRGKKAYCTNECRFNGREYRRGPDHPQWKSGTYVSAAGYLYQIDYDAPPKPDGSHRYTSVHRTVAEKKIGRSLTTDEHVHHLNGDTLDNRPENLMVMSAKEHRALHGYYARSFQQEHAGSDLEALTLTFLGRDHHRGLDAVGATASGL